jgi:hypothetical protein
MDAQPLLRKGRPPHKTTGVARTSCTPEKIQKLKNPLKLFLKKNTKALEAAGVILSPPKIRAGQVFDVDYFMEELEELDGSLQSEDENTE